MDLGTSRERLKKAGSCGEGQCRGAGSRGADDVGHIASVCRVVVLGGPWIKVCIGNLVSGKRGDGDIAQGVPSAEPEPHSGCRIRCWVGDGYWF